MSNVISPEELYEKLKKYDPLVLVDVRSPEEFSQWPLYGSINIPLATLDRARAKLSRKKTIITFCSHGKDSRAAADTLKKSGYLAYSLKGGLKAWGSIYDIILVEQKNSTLTLYQCKRLGKGCLSYVVVLPDKTSAVIIDPSRHINTYLSFLKTHKLKAIAALDTHVHTDHVSSGRKLAKKLAVPYLLPKKSSVNFPFRPIEDVLPKLAKGATVSIIATPGHTKESIAILLDDTLLFTGDTLFVDAVGRPDTTEDKNAADRLYRAVTEKLLPLKDRLFVLPAHANQPMVPGPMRAATLRYVKLFNPVSAIKGKANFDAVYKKATRIAPPHESEILAINTSRQISRNKDEDELELGGNFCSVTVETA